jgi:hypothetical protein
MMKRLDELLRLLLAVIAAWLLLPLISRWLDLIMPVAWGLLALVITVRVLFGKGTKL